MTQKVSNNYLLLQKYGHPCEEGVISLETEEIDVKLQPDEILLKMKYACLHPGSMLTIQGLNPFSKERKLPRKLGVEGAGVVEQTGDSVSKYKVGDILQPRWWSPDRDNNTLNLDQQYQQYVICKIVNEVPQNIPLQVAAQWHGNPMTVIGLIDSFGLFKEKPKGWLVQNGANSTCGRMVHALASNLGVKTIGIVRKEDAIKTCKQNGADKVIVAGTINNADDYAKAILDATEGMGVQYGVECVGDFAGHGMFKAMAQNSTLLIYGLLSGKPFKIDEQPNPNNVKSSRFVVNQYVLRPEEEYKQQVEYFLKLYYENKIQLPVEQVYKLKDYKIAFEHFLKDQSSRHGKILLDLD